MTYTGFFGTLFAVLGVLTVAIVYGEARYGVRIGLRHGGSLAERRAELRARAQFERGAARALRRLLRRDLREQETVRRDLVAGGIRGAATAGALRDVERAEQATRDELARVEMWLHRGG